jgi:hypothetical protein
LLAIGLGLLAYELIFTFEMMGGDHPEDDLDLPLTGLLLWSALAKNRLACLVLICVMAWNRETPLFAGVF